MERVTLEVTVALASGMADAYRRESLLGAVGPAIDDVIGDLGLPVECVVRIAESDGQTTNVRIGDYALAIVSPGPAGLREAIYHEPEWSIFPALADRLWQSWAARLEPCPPEAVAVMRRLACHGVRPKRMREAAARWSSVTPDAAFEEALASAQGHLVIEVNPEQHQEFMRREIDGAGNTAAAKESVAKMLEMMNDGLFYEFGLIFAEAELQPDARLGYGDFRLKLNDLHTPREAGLGADEYLVNDTPARLTLMNIEGRGAVNPANGVECSIVQGEEAADICEQAGCTTWDAAGYVVLAVSAHIRRKAAALVTTNVVDFSLGQLALAFPALVERAASVFDLSEITQALRYLVHEEISIRNLRFILENLLLLRGAMSFDLSKYILFTGPLGNPELDIALPNESPVPRALQLAECARIALKRYISYKYTRGQNTLVVYLLDPRIEDKLGERRALSSQEAAELFRAVRIEVGSLPPTAQNPVVLTTARVRYRLRHEIERQFPYLAVLSYQELSPDMNIQPIARISVEEWEPDPVDDTSDLDLPDKFSQE